MKKKNKCLYCGEPVHNKFCGVSCQNRHQNPLRKKERVIRSFDCKKCGESFDQEFIVGGNNRDLKGHCSRTCANSREYKPKTKEVKCVGCGLHIVVSDRVNAKTYLCDVCKTIKKKEKTKKPCIVCDTTIYTKNGKYCGECRSRRFSEVGRRGGRLGAQVQKETRRSKNEMYFAELCEQHFNVVLTNEPIFNGWDADVIIEDIKTAVLWNGKWHYEKITESHSVKQVQNRDRLKIKEIKKLGYKPYVIKDMGKYNKIFVEDKFSEFIKLYDK